MNRTCWWLLTLAFITRPSAGEVTRVEVKSRAVVGRSGYEKVVGTVHFAIHPADPHNRVIVDIGKATVNPRGKVEFSSSFYLLRPIDPSRANGVALVEVSNRGRKGLLTGFNRAPANLDPSTDADLGDDFLTRQGFTLAWVGWQFDVRADGNLMWMLAPRMQGSSMVVRAEFTPSERGSEVVVTDLAGYPAADPTGADTLLTVRDSQFGASQTIDRAAYDVRGNVVTMGKGFAPGRIYGIAWRTGDPPIPGVGLAAFRDFAAWLKRGDGESPRVRQAIAWGSSQSGRFLRTFLYHGFNADEGDGQVLDGVMAHIAGAAGLSINEPNATPNALSMWTATGFPYADAATTDPVSGRVEGLLENERARRHPPKIFYTNSAVEYWGGGRSAALVHTSPDGKTDLVPPDNVRVYYLTGAQHSPAGVPARVTTGQQPENPVEYWWTLRALLTAMDAWVRKETPPPASRYPTLSDGTLVPATKVAFPALPGVTAPTTIPAMRHAGQTIPLLVPQVDRDGNEIAGIRLPEVSVPVATYTGWNFRGPTVGGPSLLVALMGAAIPFASTRDTKAPGDPRPSMAERYASVDAYTAAVRAASEELVKGGYLLSADVPQIMKRAADHWSHASPAVGDAVGAAAGR